MNKLTRMLFGPRPVARETISARPAEARISTIPSRRRERLISVWTPDPETGRLVCTWRRPAAEDNCPKGDAAEPPPSLQLAA